ncbi:PREDICTED: uncharacterized protein LOC104802799 [Tarenaya hassleriana]|uniref:uncharacterized protein LOC104802799 n=1 Tax=Tarenaya hassleriana TaxID=28532 RepID=UPI00053C4038|nr:PREDICTED: uncharacterized protein LOC104802799 [Tarenaya hassleriana]
MEDDAELANKSVSAEETQVNPVASGDAGAGSSAEGSGELIATDEAAASSMDIDSKTTGREDDDDGAARVSDGERSEEVSPAAYKGSEDDGKNDKEPMFSEMKSEDRADSPIERTNPSLEVKNEVSDDQSGEIGTGDAENEEQMDLQDEQRGDESRSYAVSDYKSLLSEFDDYVASEKIGTGISRALSYGFELGDLVWGKVKSHPWWPGHIFNEAFATPSVRRTRRIGHVLVAFFGDSSYGWFDPAELIPFEPHFAEKSQQMNSKNFVRAVEEAVDEASRRSALGLTCKCRNPYNFRPTSVHGYFAVDVPDYEAQVVYSAEQIKNARDRFLPLETLSFVKQLALAPQECFSDDINFVKNRAAVSALRRAVFEEFDETYAQAFGAKTARHSVNTQEPPSKEPPRAPLSGPLVIAETLGDMKVATKPVKAKDATKQDKYLFKRRDEVGDSRTVQFGQVQASSGASQLQSADVSASGDYVLQRRAPVLQTPVKHEQAGVVSTDFTSSSGDMLGKESSGLKPCPADDKGCARTSLETTGEKTAQIPGHGDLEPMAGLKQVETGAHSRSDEVSVQPATDSPSGSSLRKSPFEGKSSGGGVIKKVKVLKRSLGEMGSENASPELKKKKKKKKEPGSGTNFEHAEKRKPLSSGEGLAKKSSQLGSAQREDKANHLKRDSNKVNMRKTDLEVPQLLVHLHALAIDPFSGSSDRGSFGAVRQFLLQFRSLTYQKSLASSPPSEAADNAKEINPLKPAKIMNRTGDPSKTGKKRLSSDRQEEIISAKKLKKTNLSKEQTGLNPAPAKSIREQQPGSAPTSQAKTAKAQPAKKAAPPPAKVVEPTMLVMKFPPGTSLPSAAQLKARFGRFGLLDQSAIRVFWKSSTCRVVFLYRADAQTAFKYATGNNSLFGNVNVRFFLRDVEAPAAEPLEPQKGKADEPNREPQKEWAGQAPPIIHQPILPPPTTQLKSCLKKPGDDNRGTARVKFVLGGEEHTSRNNAFNDGPSSSSSSVAMEFVSKNFQNVVPPLPASTLPPILPLPPQYAKRPPLVNSTMDHVNPPAQPPPRRNFHGPSHPVGVAEDISQQMMSLLSRCNDVVANVTGLLGYVPYHPL